MGLMETAQPPYPTGDTSECMLCTVPSRNKFHYPQSDMTFSNYLPFPVLHPPSLTEFSPTISKTKSLHPNLYLMLCVWENTCFVCRVLLPASGTAVLVCIFKSSHGQNPPSFPLSVLALGVWWALLTQPVSVEDTVPWPRLFLTGECPALLLPYLHVPAQPCSPTSHRAKDQFT